MKRGGSNLQRRIKPEQDGRGREGLRVRGRDGGFVANDMAMCTQWSSNVIKGMI